uniref:Uncharacterized protein n=1 Tax=Noctiluca scintillans TaxID=2966 RepID=A0A7S0ZZE5_NOCSC|mmetsp:Transcript_24833/g.65226  ORF Transcript_24833/g.65226 Transcript_24833/m.65226 type:complete len:144 (+) Transcript_24833:79-510(+)
MSASASRRREAALFARGSVDTPARHQSLPFDEKVTNVTHSRHEDAARHGSTDSATRGQDATLTTGSSQCEVLLGDPEAGIRTKVFRMGAPLLRSTIPVSLGRRSAAAEGPCGVSLETDDVETVLSISDGEEVGSLAVTLDFPI